MQGGARAIGTVAEPRPDSAGTDPAPRDAPRRVRGSWNHSSSAVDRAIGGGEEGFAVGVRADVRELRDGRLLAADVGRAALRRRPQRPQRARAEVAVEVAPLKLREPRAAVQVAAGDRAAVLVVVDGHRPDQLAAAEVVVAVADPLRSLDRAPAEVLGRLVGLEQHAVDLLDLVLADVADPDLTEREVEAEAPRVAQAEQLDAQSRRSGSTDRSLPS